MNNKPIDFYYKIAAGLGLVSFLFAILPFGIKNSLFFVSIILEIVGAVVLFFAGRSAKLQNVRPVKVGAIMGVIYGVLSGVSVFFQTITRSQMLKQLNAIHSNSPMPPGTVSNALKTANSPVVHLISFIAVIVVSVLGGLIISAIGGAMTKTNNPDAI